MKRVLGLSPVLTGNRFTDRVLQTLLDGDLARLRLDSVAESLGISGTTLRRRLIAEHTSYQLLLNIARQYRCDQVLRSAWKPGKCLAQELGYTEVNSFYRAFRRWTGVSYRQYNPASSSNSDNGSTPGDTFLVILDRHTGSIATMSTALSKEDIGHLVARHESSI